MPGNTKSSVYFACPVDMANPSIFRWGDPINVKSDCDLGDFDAIFRSLALSGMIPLSYSRTDTYKIVAPSGTPS